MLNNVKPIISLISTHTGSSWRVWVGWSVACVHSCVCACACVCLCVCLHVFACCGASVVSSLIQTLGCNALCITWLILALYKSFAYLLCFHIYSILLHLNTFFILLWLSKPDATGAICLSPLRSVSWKGTDSSSTNLVFWFTRWSWFRIILCVCVFF